MDKTDDAGSNRTITSSVNEKILFWFLAACPIDFAWRGHHDRLNVLPGYGLLKVSEIGLLNLVPAGDQVVGLLLEFIELLNARFSWSGVRTITDRDSKECQLAVDLLRISQRIFVGFHFE